MTPEPAVDADFAALPLATLADAALSQAAHLGAEHVEVRVEAIRDAELRVRDRALESARDSLDVGVSVRVLRGGVWGFAASAELTPDAAARVATQAVDVARVSAALSTERVELAAEAVHAGETWVAPHRRNPFTVPVADRIAVLLSWTERLLGAAGVDHADAAVLAVQEDKYLATSAGTTVTQRRVRVHPEATAVAVDPASGAFDTMRTLAPPTGRGWEYLEGDGWDWDRELAELPGHLAERMAAPSVTAGTYDLVIDPSNLWLTIHESIGHATELDRVLGYEAAYAGTSFATLDQLGTLRYGSPVMHVTADRTEPHGLATVAFDDEGVAAQRWDLIRDGVLVGYQLDRAMAARVGAGRSNGCAFADAPGHVPLQRMANVSLQPAPGGPGTEELIGAVDDGIYVVGDRSWSIDMQRYNFQFSGQRFYRIRHGRLAGQLSDVAYQGTTTEFWGSLEAVGGPASYVLGGAFNCGKGQPGQVAAVSHGCPSALFRGVRVLNTAQESGRGEDAP